MIIVVWINLLIIFLFIFTLVFFKKDKKKIKVKQIDWNQAHKAAKNFVSKLNLDEKLNLMYGTENMIDREKCIGQLNAFSNSKVKFKGMCLQDGPAGVRIAKNKNSWHASINTAATFNKKLAYKIGKAQGEAFYKKGINTVLGPCVNIMRSPLGGRIWEAYGDDPFLTGVMGTEIVKGIQSKNVIATAKHFILNDQETYRKFSSSNVGEQALWEIYIEPFYKMIKEGDVGSIMVSYNQFNGTWVTQSKYLINDIIKKKLGFKGFLMSDWFAIYDNEVESVTSGLDVNMPGGKHPGPGFVGKDKSYWSEIPKWISDKKVEKKRIDDAAERVIATMYRFNQMNFFPDFDLHANAFTKYAQALNLKAAEQSNVLLQNKDNILPLNIKKIKRIAIIGNDAENTNCLRKQDCYQRGRYHGHMALGYGSGTTFFEYLIDPLSAIKKRARKKRIKVLSSTKLVNKNEEDIKTAKNIAARVDVALVFINANSGEGHKKIEESRGDRFNLDAWHKGNELVRAVSKVNKNVIVIINAPGPINLEWRNDVKAIIFSGFPGPESGNAITHVLFGDISPSGHLPFVWGKREDYPADINAQYQKPKRNPKEIYQIDYNEGIYVGQRWFDKHNKNFIYPFGFGLSYTLFNFTDLNIAVENSTLQVYFKVKNVGKYDAYAVALLFLGFPKEIKNYPKKVFKGFEKKFITKQETIKFKIIVSSHDLSYYNTSKHDFVRPTGNYTVYIGENAHDVKLSETINLAK